MFLTCTEPLETNRAPSELRVSATSTFPSNATMPLLASRKVTVFAEVPAKAISVASTSTQKAGVFILVFILASVLLLPAGWGRKSIEAISHSSTHSHRGKPLRLPGELQHPNNSSRGPARALVNTLSFLGFSICRGLREECPRRYSGSKATRIELGARGTDVFRWCAS